MGHPERGAYDVSLQYTCRSSGELAECLTYRGDARFDVGQCSLDANAIGPGEPVIATALHELQHLDRLDRGIGYELQLNRSVRRVDSRDAERLAQDAQAMTVD